MTRTVQPTMNFRWVDKSTCPQLHTDKVLQQMVFGPKGSEWIDVPFAGHITELENPND